MIQKDSAHQADRRPLEPKPPANRGGKPREGLRALPQDSRHFGGVFEEQGREARQIVLLRGLCPDRQLAQRIEAEGSEKSRANGVMRRPVSKSNNTRRKARMARS